MPALAARPRKVSGAPVLNNSREICAHFKEIEKTFNDYESTIGADKKKLEDERTKLVNQLEEQLQKRSILSKNLSRPSRSVLLCMSVKRAVHLPKNSTAMISRPHMLLGGLTMSRQDVLESVTLPVTQKSSVWQCVRSTGALA